MKDKQKFLKNSLHFPQSENKTDVENRKKKLCILLAFNLMFLTAWRKIVLTNSLLYAMQIYY